MTLRPVLPALLAANTTIGIPATYNRTLPGSREEFVRACKTTTLFKLIPLLISDKHIQSGHLSNRGTLVS